jgi:hypothetical protein
MIHLYQLILSLVRLLFPDMQVKPEYQKLQRTGQTDIDKRPQQPAGYSRMQNIGNAKYNTDNHNHKTEPIRFTLRQMCKSLDKPFHSPLNPISHNKSQCNGQ